MSGSWNRLWFGLSCLYEPTAQSGSLPEIEKELRAKFARTPVMLTAID